MRAAVGGSILYIYKLYIFIYIYFRILKHFLNFPNILFREYFFLVYGSIKGKMCFFFSLSIINNYTIIFPL